MSVVDDPVTDSLDQEREAVEHYLASLLKQQIKVTELRVGNGVVEKNGPPPESVAGSEPAGVDGLAPAAEAPDQADEPAMQTPAGVEDTAPPPRQTAAAETACADEEVLISQAPDLGMNTLPEMMTESDEPRLAEPQTESVAAGALEPVVPVGRDEAPSPESMVEAASSEEVQGPEQAETDESCQGESLAAAAVEVSERAAQELDLRVFRVGGIRLAVPFNEILGQGACGATIKVKGTPEWLYATRHEGRPAWLIDAFRLVFPPSQRGRRQPPEHHTGEVIWLRPDGVGLWCEALEGELELDPAEVTWSTRQRKRAWLAGTVAAQRCAIVDVASLLGLLPE